MKNRVITILTITLIIFYALIPTKVYAEETADVGNSDFTYQNFEQVEKEGLQNYQSILKEGSAAVNGNQVDIKEVSGEGSTIMKTLVRVLCYIPQSAQLILSVLTTPYMQTPSRRRF